MVTVCNGGRTWQNGVELPHLLRYSDCGNRRPFIEIHEWSKEQLEGKIDANIHGYLFEKESDMILFKLRWG